MTNYRNHLLTSGSTIKEALELLDKLAQDAILFVVDDRDRLVGALTDGDVRRGLLKGIGIDDSISTIIQPNPRFIRKGEPDITKIIEFREGLFRIIPIIDDKGIVVNVINFREIRSYLPVDAVIMAGGRGQRLMPLTAELPKPLLNVGDLPIIEHNLNRLTLFGIDDFWISVNYLGGLIKVHLGDGKDRNIKISYVWEDQPLGTIGSVSLIDDFLHDYILISNSDILTNLDYENFFLEFIQSGADLGVVTIPYQVNIPYAVFEMNENIVTSFKEKPTYTYYSNGGIYLLKRSVLEFLPKNVQFDATDLLEKLINDGREVFSYPFVGYWLDIGNHGDYAKAQLDIKSIRF